MNIHILEIKNNIYLFSNWCKVCHDQSS